MFRSFSTGAGGGDDSLRARRFAGKQLQQRVLWPSIDATLLGTGSLVFSLGEVIQTEQQQRVAAGLPPYTIDGLGKIFEWWANNPLDNKALGLSLAVVALSKMVGVVRNIHKINSETMIVQAGLGQESALGSRKQRLTDKLRTVGITGLSAAGAYAAGTHMPMMANLGTSAALIASGAAYTFIDNKRRTGKFLESMARLEDRH